MSHITVLKFGGSSLADLDALAAYLEGATSTVIVHGGGPEIQKQLDRVGVPSEFRDGLRVTSPETMDVVEMVLAGRVNKRIVAHLQKQGLPAAGLSGVDGSTLLADLYREGEWGRVGEIAHVKTDLLQTLLNGGFLPVVSPVAFGHDHEPLNVNADTAAAAVAGALKAKTFVFFTDVPGLRDADGNTVAAIGPTGIAQMIESGVITGGMIPKIEAALHAIELGVGEVVIRSLASTSTGTILKGDTMSSLFANYKRAEVAFTHGMGVKLYDTTGKEYLDFLSGIAVSSLGHSHPRLVKALQEQAGKLLHVSNLYTIPEQEAAAAKLTRVCGFDKAFFCNSGAEANEALIKIARRYAHAHGLQPNIVVTHNSFHGRTMATVSATGNPKYQENFHPLVEGFTFVDYNDTEQTLKALEGACAILIEPVQGEGGVVPADPAYLQAIENACRFQKKLFFLDEVQTGIGRSGAWLAAQRYGVKPDAVALAKGLGGGVPVGAVLASEALAALLPPGAHGTTFGGNLLASAAALTVLEVIEEENLLANVEAMSEYLQRQLLQVPGAKEVRGMGLLLAVELEVEAGPVAEACLAAGLLVNAVRPTALRLAPPLIVSQGDIDRAIMILEDAICQQTKSVAAASAP